MSANRMIRNDPRNSNPQTTPPRRPQRRRRGDYNYAEDGRHDGDDLTDALEDGVIGAKVRRTLARNQQEDSRLRRLSIFKRFFLSRIDVFPLLAPWGKPCPASAGGNVDDLLGAHLTADKTPEVTVRWASKKKRGIDSGHYRVGAYCIATDNTVKWLCIDLDGDNHANPLPDPAKSAVAVVNRLKAAGIPAYLEKSGSGKGWHVWVFFSKPLPAEKARQLGRAFLDDDRIEVFPKQDKLPKGGRGNFVWLPWWSGAANGANQFYLPNEHGHLKRVTPKVFKTVDEKKIDRLLASSEVASDHETKTKSERKSSKEVTRRRRRKEYDYAAHGRPDRPLDNVLEFLKDSTLSRSGDGWIACCPAHNDCNPSLSVSEGDDGRVLLFCHSGCEVEDIAEAMGMEMSDLFAVQNHVVHNGRPPKDARQPTRSKSKPKSEDASTKKGALWDGRPETAPDSAKDWSGLVRQCQERISRDQREQLADQLGVLRMSLDLLCVGCMFWKNGEGCYTFPEYNGTGQIVGIATRCVDGTKRTLKGSKRGLYLPNDWYKRPGPVLIAEGASDTAALTTMKLAGIGRPSATGGVEYLADLLLSISVKRPIVVLAEFDPKPDGAWPGLAATARRRSQTDLLKSSTAKSAGS